MYLAIEEDNIPAGNLCYIVFGRRDRCTLAGEWMTRSKSSVHNVISVTAS